MEVVDGCADRSASHLFRDPTVVLCFAERAVEDAIAAGRRILRTGARDLAVVDAEVVRTGVPNIAYTDKTSALRLSFGVNR